MPEEDKEEKSSGIGNVLKSIWGSKYNPFRLANIQNGVRAVGTMTVDTLEDLWNVEEEESWLSRTSLFIPRIVGSTLIGAVSAAVVTTMAGVGVLDFTVATIGAGVLKTANYLKPLAKSAIKTFWDSKYNLFKADNTLNAIRGIGTTAIDAIKGLWNPDRREGWVSKIFLFIPRIVGSTLVGAVATSAAIVTASIGALGFVAEKIGSNILKVFKKKKDEDLDDIAAVKPDQTDQEDGDKAPVKASDKVLNEDEVAGLRVIPPRGEIPPPKAPGVLQNLGNRLLETDPEFKGKITCNTSSSDPSVVEIIGTGENKGRLFDKIKNNGSSIECVLKQRSIIGTSVIHPIQKQLFMKFLQDNSDPNNPPRIEAGGFSPKLLKSLLDSIDKEDPPIFVKLVLPPIEQCRGYKKQEYDEFTKRINLLAEKKASSMLPKAAVGGGEEKPPPVVDGSKKKGPGSGPG